MGVISGSYVGDGTDNRAITGIGFQPDVVWIKGDGPVEGIVRVSTMGFDQSKPMDAATPLVSNAIQQFLSNGFEIGTTDYVNRVGTTYYWTAFRAACGQMVVGTYTGNGGTQSISGLGFQPDYVMIMGEGTQHVVHRSSLMTKTYTLAGFDAGNTNRITSFDVDGFSVGSDPEVNTNGVTYHYIAWKRIAGQFEIGSYVGNGLDNRDITGLGFEPEVVIIQKDERLRVNHKTFSMGPSNDFSCRFQRKKCDRNRIQALLADGFQVGTERSVNENGKQYFWISWKRFNPTWVDLVWAQARGGPDGVLVAWRTSREVNNLGFHVYRETDRGELVRVTSSPVPGTAFLGGAGTRFRAGRSYRIWDPQGRGAVRYWLEDVDLDGTTRWHGPIAILWGNRPVGGDRAVQVRPGQPHRRRHHRSRFRHRRLGPVPAWMSAIREEARRTTLAFSPRRMRVQYRLEERRGVKVYVNQEGWYRVSGAALLAAGLKRGLDLRRLRVYVEGREVPRWVRDRGRRGLDRRDDLEFYGIGLDVPGSDARVYWVTAGRGRGIRLRSMRGRGRPSGRKSFLMTVEKRPREIYFPALINGQEENFYGPVVWRDPVSVGVKLHHIDTAAPGDAVLEVVLQGVTEVPGVTPDHVVVVEMNGQAVGDVRYEGQGHGVLRRVIPHAWLREGNNEIRLWSEGGALDVSLLVAVRVTYWHRYVAEAGQWARFSVAWGERVKVQGFGSKRIRVLDVTDPDRVRTVRGKVRAERDGSYTLIVGHSGRGWQRVYFAYTVGAIRRPLQVRRNTPSRWHRRVPGGTVMVVTHRAFRDAAEAYAKLRRRSGWSVAVVDVEDAYDAYAYGVRSVDAVRQLVRRAVRVWRKKPRFLVLFGDASFDPRNFLGMGDYDFVPTVMVGSRYLETAWDDGFGDLNGDGVPEVVVGRFPARTAAEAWMMMTKLQHYRADGQVVLAADRRDKEYDFTAMSEKVAAVMPSWLAKERVYLDVVGDVATARTALVAAWRNEASWVQYLGHGSMEIWSPTGFLRRTDVAPLLGGVEHLPVVLGFTCLNAFFHYLYSDSLGEELVKVNGGAVAVWSSSGLTEAEPQVRMAQALFRAVYRENVRTLGDAIRRAKAAVQDLDVRRTWNLLGDPVLPLR